MFVGIRNCVFVQKILGESGQLNNTVCQKVEQVFRM